MTARLVSLFSGSSGNCTAINCGGNTILIDAGRSAKAIEEQLAVAGIDPGTLRAVFVTHEHIDHVSALRVLTKKHPMPGAFSRHLSQTSKTAVFFLQNGFSRFCLCAILKKMNVIPVIRDSIGGHHI